MFSELNESDDADAARDSYVVILESRGNRKIDVVKAVREITSLSLQESVELVESAPTIIKSNLSMDEAEVIQRRLQKVGAKVTID
jgi:large subunit ribosomal protein L7/L12